jgi:alpha-1,2-mannosyltransferase
MPLLAWPLLARRYRAFAWASGCTTVLLAGGFAVGPLGPSAYAGLLSALGAHEAKSGFGLTGAFMTAGLAPALSEAAAAVFAAAVLVAVYFRFRQTCEEAVLFCGAVVASVIATPVLWSHYLALLAAALLAAGAPRRWFLLLVLASWVIAPPHGITIHVQPSQSVASHGAWLALATSLVVIGYAMRRGHRFSQRYPT